MSIIKSIIKTTVAAALGVTAVSAAAQAEDKLTYSITAGATSDYVFRGFSNSNRQPAAQGSVDLSYGIYYAGIWASRTNYPNFGSANGPVTGTIGPAEVDFYLGAKPVLGPVTFDFAFLYYMFPGQNGNTNQGDYIELKAAGSYSPIQNLTLSLSNYYSPNAQWESGETFTIEGGAAYTLPAMGPVTPTISGSIGNQWGFDPNYVNYAMAWGDDQYMYWNAGFALAVDKFTFDFRYWDTALSDAADAACNFSGQTAGSFQCGSTFVFTAKVTLP